ncbi:TolB family protein [Cytobacillus sp. FJAT-54145]|uniref:TolB family protein n=1 Tax=Cytobacillus spartinae TaxID=3299023 RepID=A0ABW6KJ27_9BACI
MWRFLISVIICTLFFPPTMILADNIVPKAAFVRDGNLWIFINNAEKQITFEGKVFDTPQWSPDGQSVIYQRLVPSEYVDGEDQSEVWIYHIQTEEKKKLFHDGYSPRWAPGKNILSFNSKGILNISDMEKFYNIATGVSGYTWLPDGSGFLLSSSGVLRPDGWTSSILYTKKVKDNYSDIILFGGVDHFFTLPREIGVDDNNKIIAVYSSDFTFSPSNNWISFVVSPTASWSMDSNMLCVISSDGKDFEVLDEMILDVGKPKWAPSNDTIAFIAGGGRIVFGFKNKDLKVREMPVSGTYTPEDYADLDFDWISNDELVTSRIKEKEWSNDFSEHPLPSLYFINLPKNKQIQVSHPPKGFGDFAPQYVSTMKQLVWLRGTSITDHNRTLWKANPDGTGAEEWIKNVELITFFKGYGKED